MGFEDDPRDEKQEFPCECGGTIGQDPDTGVWGCNLCEFQKEPIVEANFTPIYMMATTATHKLGDISSDIPDLCRITSEDTENYIGMWVEGLGFFGVKFPKKTTRLLTSKEKEKYAKMGIKIGSQPSYPLNIS